MASRKKSLVALLTYKLFAMKKIIFAGLLVFICMTGFSQFTFGPIIGYSASKLNTNFQDIKEDFRSNYQIGAFLRMGKKFYFQPEVVYATSGGKLDSAGSIENIKFQNLDIPLLLGFKIINAKVINFRILAGPTASFIINKNISLNNLENAFVSEDELKNVAWGFDLGAGLDILLFSLDVRYRFGLNDLYDSSAGGDIYDIKNDLVIVTLGFKLM